MLPIISKIFLEEITNNMNLEPDKANEIIINKVFGPVVINWIDLGKQAK